ncbi:hypothetical protein Tco_0599379 [Tanacetum coccineum]
MERITIKEYELESEVFDLLKIDLDLFTCNTPLGMIFDVFRRLSSMEDDLFAYELGILEDFYFPCVEQPCDNFKNGDLDVYKPRQCYDEYERMFAEDVILIDDRLVKLIDISLEQWLDLKFGDHEKVDKEIMEEVVSTWLVRSYRKQFKEYMEIKRRFKVNRFNTDVECDPTNIEFPKWLTSKFNNHKMMDWYTKNALWLYWKGGDDEEIFTYDELCDLEEENAKFKEFNHLLQIDVDVLTGDLLGFKTYEDYKNALIYEWNNEVSWVEEKPWLYNGTWEEPNDDIFHDCKPFQFKSRHYEGLEDCDLKDEALKEKAIFEGSCSNENRKRKNFCSWLKECLDQERFDNHEPMEDDDYDIWDLEDYLIP